jgi:membrane protein implicated in regulation of membrane protease activity
MNGAAGINIVFFDSWAWLIFIGVGLFLMILELFIGIDTGLDLVFVGTAFALAGLVTLAIGSWVWTALVAGIICLVYVVVGRRFVHRRTAVPATRTNIDLIVGKNGIVQQEIRRERDGQVKVGNEEWRARSEVEIKAGEEIVVTGVSGVTLNVKPREGEETK